MAMSNTPSTGTQLPVIVRRYIREMQYSLHPQIIPNEINDLCFKYYFALCKNPVINNERAEELANEGNVIEAYYEISRSFECRWKQSLMRYYKSLKLVKEEKIKEAYDEMHQSFDGYFQITTQRKHFHFYKRLLFYVNDILIPLQKHKELESLISTLVRRDPTFAAMYLDIKAEALRGQNKMDEALKIAKENTKTAPNNQYFWITQSDILFDIGQYKQCKECILKAMELDPHSLAHNKKYIMLLRQLCEWKEIEEFTDKLLETDPNNSLYLHYKSEALQKQNKLDKALETAAKNAYYHPDKYLSLYSYAQMLFEMKQYEKCKKFRIANMKLAPNDKNHHYQYIEVLKELNATDELHSFCDELIRNRPNSSGTYFSCAMVNKWEKDMEEAIFNMEKAIKLDPQNKFYYAYYYRLLFDAHKYDKCKECVESLMKLQPYNVDRKLLYIDILEKLQAWDELFAFLNDKQTNNVISQITRAIEQNPKNTENISRYSDILFRLKQYEKCRRNRKKAMDMEPENYNYKIKYFQVLQTMTRWKEANDFCSELIKRYPNSIDVHYKSAISYVLQFDMDNALKQIKKTMKLAPNDLFYVAEYAFFLNLNNNNKLARQIIEDEWNQNKKHYRLSYVYGAILQEEGKYEESEKHFYAAIKQLDNSSVILRCYGYLYFVREEYKKSAEYFEKAVNDYFPNPFTHYYHALSLCKLRQYNKALDAFNESLNFWPNNPKCHYDLGILLVEQLGKYKEGKMHIKRAKELDPKNEKYAKLNLQPLTIHCCDVNGNFKNTNTKIMD